MERSPSQQPSAHSTKGVFQDALKKLLIKGSDKRAAATHQTSGHLTIKVPECVRVGLI